MYFDYHILIESIEDPEQYKIIKELNDLAIEEANFKGRVRHWMDREKLKKHLCGVGRIIQYYNLAPAHSLINFNDAS